MCVWRDIPEFNGRYAVSDDGQVRRNAGVNARGARVDERVLKPVLMNAGYLKVGLTLPNGRKCTRLVHRLVAEAFVPGHTPGLDVNHVNGVKTDNRAVNLEWTTRAENIQHARRLGLIDDFTPGRRAAAKRNGLRLQRLLGHPVRVRTADGRVQTFPSCNVAAKALGVSDATMHRVLHGERGRQTFTVELVLDGVTTSPEGRN